MSTRASPLNPPASAQPTAAPPEPRLFDRDRAAASAGAVALISMLAFEALATAAVMPAVATALDGLGSYALSFGGPMALSVLGMVLAGQSADRHGAWRATAAGLLLFAAGLLVAGLAPGMGWLVLGRMLQGLGGGMLGVTLYVGMGQVVPAALHPRLFSLFATAWVLPGLVGPSLAAALVGWLGWRSVFLVVAAAVPVAAALLLPAYARLPAAAVDRRAQGNAPAARARLAWAAVAAAGALALHGAGQLANGTPLGSASLALLSGGLLAALLAASRLLPPGSLRAGRGLPAAVALRGLMAASFATAEVFLPLLLTQQHHWSLAQVGLALSAGAVSWSAGSALQSRLLSPQHRRIGLVTGFALLGAGITGLALPQALGWPALVVVPAWAVAGFGIGLGFPMLSVLTLALSAPGTSGRNASALQLSDALTCSASLAVAGALYTSGAAPGGLLVLALAAALAAAGALLGSRAFGLAVVDAPRFSRT